MKKLVTLMLALAMIISAVGVLAEADGKITIWTWDPTFNIKAMQIAKEMYLKDHPDAVIDIQEKLSEDIETAVIASNGDTSTLPDILLVQDNSFQKFVTNYPEVYADLTGKYDYEGFAEGKLAYSIVDGKNHGIPFDAGTAVAAYRTDYLEAAGYTAADLKDITWERFIEIGRDVKAKTGRPMLSGQAGAVDTVLIMLQSCGASMFNEDGSVNLKDNEQLKEVIDFYATMVKEGIFIEVNTWDEYIGTLSNQTVVGTIQGCWILSTIMSLQDQKGLWAMTNLLRARPTTPATAAPAGRSSTTRTSTLRLTSCRCTATSNSTTRFCRRPPPSRPTPRRRKAPTTLRAPSSSTANRSSPRSSNSARRPRPTSPARITTTPAKRLARRSPTSFSRAATWIPSWPLPRIR